MITDEMILQAYHSLTDEEQHAALRLLKLEEVKPMKRTAKDQQKIELIALALKAAEYAAADHHSSKIQ